MRREKKLIRVLVCLLFLSVTSVGAPVTIDKASTVAVNFYSMQYSRTFGIAPEYHALTCDAIWVDGQVSYYVCNFSNNGFVLVSADDNAFPIIGYSFESNIDMENLPSSLEYWLGKVSESIKSATTIQPSKGYNSLWQKLCDKNQIHEMQQKSLLSVAPLITLKWDQGVPYNNDCPANSDGPGGHCVTGCVATAMAQIMKYHNYPDHGRDSMLYTGNLLLDFENTYYRWSEMTNVANSSSASSIAELMFHCGATVYMYYGPDGSSSNSALVPYALIHNFRYHPSAGYIQRKNVEDRDWDLMIRNDLDMFRPLYYSGSGTGGHAFVCDGYQDTCFYHFNWGWGGSGNGYFFNDALSPGGNDFSYEQGIVSNIKPYFGDYCRNGRVLTDLYRGFNDGSDISYYWNNTNCNWLISPPGTSKITLSFSSFSTQANADFLYIYDGTDTTATLIGKYSGNQLPPTVISSTGHLFLVFTSDSTVQGKGWEAYYEADNINVPETYLENSIRFYPNPVNDEINIVMGRGKSWTGKIGLYNITGELLKSKDVILENSNPVSISVSEFPNGFYLLKTVGEDGEFVQKMIKQ